MNQLPIAFNGRHALVFGGTTGINFGIAEAYARAGADVTVVSRKSDNVETARAALQALQGGGRVFGTTADVRDFDAVGSALDAAVAACGPIDVLVSGAAGNFLCEARDMSSGGFKVVVDIDLVGTFHVMRQALSRLHKPGASVINITAPQSWIPMRYQVHCGAAKAGVDQITRVLALEWGGDGIRVNAISPGPIEATEGVKRLMAPDEATAARTLLSVPLKRMGSAQDIANLALFLGSPYASFISGAIIPCDGGGAIDSVKPALEAAGLALAAGASR